jgi:ATP-dependent RNA helicase SUPV3L1/SUV3
LGGSNRATGANDGDNRRFAFASRALAVSSSSTPTPARHDTQALDELTGGAFSAPTAGERAARVRAWLQQEPVAEQMQLVYRELSVKDKGAAKLLREKLDELKRQRDQEGMASEWAHKAQALLDAARLNLADALAWQRDAAKAGAPLSREPLATLKLSLADRVRAIEDLQHRAQVQREAAVLLAQRIEVLSTKSWQDAQTAVDGLSTDVAHWLTEAAALPDEAHWASIDLRFAPQLEASRAQLSLVWEAFSAALAQARTAAADPSAALPQVPVWADELRQARGGAPAEAAAAPKPKVDPELRARANAAVREVLGHLEQEIAQGHGKASTGAAQALRQALKDHGRHIDAQLDRQAHAALAAAGELEGWQRWRADQLREELVAKAEALLKRPEGQTLGGRKMQESLRELRDQWKQTDQGGVPNHALWKRFDEACNQAYKVVEAWLEKIKTEAAEHKSKRLALIEELKVWAVAHAAPAQGDWKTFSRELHQYAERWRDAGHLSEKAFAELQPLWKSAMASASAPLDVAQKESLQRRQAMIEEASQLGAAPMLRIDAVKALQQRWQAEVHAVPLDRRQEQKLWDAFRKPIDEAFARKSAVREQAAAAMSEHDRAVLEAAQALEAANASGDAQAIRATMAALEAALQGRTAAATVPTTTTPAAGAAETPSAPRDDAAPSAAAVPPQPRKPVVAVRGDDRPGMKRAEPAAPAGRGRPGERRDGPRREERRPERADRAERPLRDTPRLGDTAFRAQRDALEHAQGTLKKLAAQAHGEALTQLLSAWEQRDAARLPSTSELGGRVTPAVRTLWTQALSAPAGSDAAEALLRLEMAAEVPTPAEQLDARRALQLQLLTRRNDAPPAQTWGQDAARVLGAAHEAGQARRLQQVLKVLLRR